MTNVALNQMITIFIILFRKIRTVLNTFSGSGFYEEKGSDQDQEVMRKNKARFGILIMTGFGNREKQF